MTYSELKSALYSLISNATNLFVIFADENGTKPNVKFITIKITTINMLGHRDYTAPNDDGHRTTRIIEDFNLSLTSHGDKTGDALQEVKTFLQKESTIQELSNLEIAIRDESVIQDISIEINKKIERRYIYELVMGFAHDFEENVGVIENYAITSTINQPV